jgi:hypothetical protein
MMLPPEYPAIVGIVLHNSPYVNIIIRTKYLPVCKKGAKKSTAFKTLGAYRAGKR